MPQLIDGRDRFIAGPGRQIHEEKIQILPLDAAEQLVDEFVLISVAPNDGIVRILEQEGHGGDLEIVGLVRDDPARRADLQLLPLCADHLRDVRPVDVHIADADMPALESETDRDVGRAGALAHPAFIAHDEHLVFDALHPFGDEPAAVAFLVFLTGFVLVADRAGPHIRAGVAAAGRRSLDDVQFASHVCIPFLLVYPPQLVLPPSVPGRHTDIIAVRRTRHRGRHGFRRSGCDRRQCRPWF